MVGQFKKKTSIKYMILVIYKKLHLEFDNVENKMK